ncbi:hypothetical protein D9611_002000 [Ephemerocybe angulata]|uniref:DUF7918 domain-containing protein n=1 Tax=Ephemerocybe angulata TaxID=980116 RepID=A0A8H5CIU6_9AGAR|nr:hypothetical protein D9611_002000 [Tulosesus angulatus]
MPVSPQGYEAWIEIGGKRLEEYKVETSEDARVVCWIPCEAGKEFSIKLTIPSERHRATNHTIQAYLDGELASLHGNVIYTDVAAYIPKTVTFSDQLVEQRRATRAFQFGSLELTDDETYLGAATKEFGEIKVAVNSVQRYVAHHEPYGAASSAIKEDYRVHERAKKGLAHCVKLGAEKPVASRFKMVQAVGASKVCTFVFKYRHMDILEANGIAARKAENKPTSATSPNSVPGPSNSGASGSGQPRSASGKRKADEVKAEEDDTSDGDIESLEARLAALKEKKASKRVKQEPKSTLVHGEVIDLTNLPLDESGSQRRRVKREPASTLVSGEVIDLT